MQNMTITAKFPQLSYSTVIVKYTTVDMVLMLDRQAEVRCLAVLKDNIPNFQITDVKNSIFHGVLTSTGGLLRMILRDLMPGEKMSIFCYTVELTDAIFKYDMQLDDVLDTENEIRTLGPSAANYTAFCEVGQKCSLNLSGIGLSQGDRILVRSEPCRGECKCAGVTDPQHKGAECTTLSQEPHVHGEGPFKEDLPLDPMGAWCYVVPEDGCPDRIRSEYYPYEMGLYVSFKACENELTHLFDNFPYNGLSVAQNDGTIHSWGPERINTSGTFYNLCWCAGDLMCDYGSKFVLRIGSLSVIGPTEDEKLTVHKCMMGQVCRVKVGAHGVSAGTLAVRELHPDGCYAGGQDVSDVILDYFPNGGLAYFDESEDDNVNEGSSSSFILGVPNPASERENVLRVPLGTYQLCYCLNCTESIPGETHFAPAGTLLVSGPSIEFIDDDRLECFAGQPCRVEITGTELHENNMVIAATECSAKPVMPAYWFG